MSVFLLTDANPTSPLSTMPYLEKDSAIIRNVTKAMIDWSNPDSYSGAGNIVTGASFGNLVDGGSPAALTGGTAPGSYLAALVDGTLPMDGAASAGGYPLLNLPSGFNLAGATRAMVILWAKIGAAGWSNSSLPGVMRSDNGSTVQYTVFLSTNGSGVPTEMKFRVRGSSGNIDASLTGAGLTALMDGDLHQLGFAILVSGGQGQAIIYVDGEVAASSAQSAMTAVSAGGIQQMLSGFGTGNMLPLALGSGTRFGRISAHDLSARPDLTFYAILEADAQGAAGYLS